MKDEIKKIVEEFLQKMTVKDFTVNVEVENASETKKESGGVFAQLKSSLGFKKTDKNPESIEVSETSKSFGGQVKPVVKVNVTLAEPQLLIGQNGQTLFEIQRLLGALVNKKLSSRFYVSLDINGYKVQKIEHLKNMAHKAAKDAISLNEPQTLSPMSSYERKIIHQELSQWKGIESYSQGEGEERRVVVAPHK